MMGELGIIVSGMAHVIGELVAGVVALALADPLALLLQAFILVSGLAGQYLVAHRNTAGFWVWIASNGALIWVSVEKALIGMVLLYFIYTFMCLYSIRKWKQVPA